MINFLDLQKDIRDVIVALTGLNVIWSEENGNTPSGDFVLLKINSLDKLYYQDYSGYYNNTLGKAKTQGNREFVLSVQCISKNSMGILAELISQFDLQENYELLGKLVFVTKDGDINDITTKIDDRFEHRSAVDLRFRISKNYTQDLGDNVSYIETVQIESNINGFEDNFES
tara:strand:+ start:67 stop:582 length:516 start_codon:yes stop_codon:yes gene_type:complete